jgi:hypothetical protein
LAGRGAGLLGWPWSRTGTGAAFSAIAGIRDFARPRLATAPVVTATAFGDAPDDAADAADAAATAAAARSDAWRPRQTRAERTIWSFSASGVSLTQVRGSVR